MFKYEYDESAKILALHDGYADRETYFSFDPAEYSLTMSVVDKYLGTLFDHIRYVREFGEKVGVPEYQLRNHDYTKFDREEMPYYARQFQGDKGDPNGFARAWLHHIHLNEHHWQHWLLPDGYTPKDSHVENGALPMPENFVREMVADWAGANMAYQGTWNMAQWLSLNAYKMKLHSFTWITLCEILLKLPEDYSLFVSELKVEGIVP